MCIIWKNLLQKLSQAILDCKFLSAAGIEVDHSSSSILTPSIRVGVNKFSFHWLLAEAVPWLVECHTAVPWWNKNCSTACPVLLHQIIPLLTLLGFPVRIYKEKQLYMELVLGSTQLKRQLNFLCQKWSKNCHSCPQNFLFIPSIHTLNGGLIWYLLRTFNSTPSGKKLQNPPYCNSNSSTTSALSPAA